MKTRKLSVLCLLVAVVAICFLVACEEESKQVNYTGTWKVTEGKANGVRLTGEQLTTTLGEITMNVESEGKITDKKGIGLDENGKWTATENGIMVSDLDGSNSVTFTYKDGTLTGAVKGIDITLKK